MGFVICFSTTEFAMYALLLLAAMIVVAVAVQIALTHATAKLLRLPTATWRRAAVVVLALAVLNIAFVSAEYFATKSNWLRLNTAGWIFAGVLLLAAILWIYRRAYQTTGRQLWAFFALQIVSAAVGYRNFRLACSDQSTCRIAIFAA